MPQTRGGVITHATGEKRDRPRDSPLANAAPLWGARGSLFLFLSLITTLSKQKFSDCHLSYFPYMFCCSLTTLLSVLQRYVSYVTLFLMYSFKIVFSVFHDFMWNPLLFYSIVLCVFCLVMI